MSSAGQVSDETHVLDLVRTELGLLPKDWRVVRLGDLFDVRQGAAMSPKRRQGRNPRPFLRTLNVLWGRLDLSNVDQMDFSTEEVDRLALEVGDLLVCEGGEIGRTAIWRGELSECLYQNHLHRLRRRDDTIEPEFYMYWMQAAFLQLGLYGGQANKTTIPNLSRSRLMAFPVPLPPLSEQRAIAHVLRTVQQAKEATEAVIAAIRELKKSLMRHLFTYGPVPVDQADQVPLQETNHGDVPAAWEIRSLREIAHVQTGVAKGRKIKDAHTVEVPYLRVANVQDGYIDLSEIKTIRLSPREIGRYQLQAGDIVLTEGGDFDKLGRGFVWDGRIPGMVHQNHVFAVRADQRVILPHYLGYLIQSSYAKSYFLTVAHRTTNLASINSTKLGDFPVPVPTLAEQQRIVDVLRVVDHEIRVESGKFAALDALFSSLLYHLMTGKVRVGDAILADVTSGFPGVSILADP